MIFFPSKIASDMDPVTRSIVYASINRLLLDNRSVILTSHTITEIDRVCDRIGIMRQGQMIVTAPPQQLKAMYGNRYDITIYYDQIEALTIERVRYSFKDIVFCRKNKIQMRFFSALISGYQKDHAKY